jgi:hypothetical protein
MMFSQVICSNGFAKHVQFSVITCIQLPAYMKQRLVAAFYEGAQQSLSFNFHSHFIKISLISSEDFVLWFIFMVI